MNYDKMMELISWMLTWMAPSGCWSCLSSDFFPRAGILVIKNQGPRKTWVLIGTYQSRISRVPKGVMLVTTLQRSTWSSSIQRHCGCVLNPTSVNRIGNQVETVPWCGRFVYEFTSRSIPVFFDCRWVNRVSVHRLKSLTEIEDADVIKK